MFIQLFKFELLTSIKRSSTYIYFIVFFAIAFTVMSLMGSHFKGFSLNISNSDVLYANSPFVLFLLIAGLSHFGIFATMAIMGQAVLRDFDNNCHPLYFTYPITKAGYLLGRFAASISLVLIIFSSLAIGALAASLMPYIDHTLFTSHQLLAYITPYLYTIIPNVIFTGAVFFTMSVLTRQTMAVYVTGLVFVLGYLIAGSFLGNLGNRLLVDLIDPFGIYAMLSSTALYSIAEKNNLLINLSGSFLLNRILWLSISFIVFIYGYYKFMFSFSNQNLKVKKIKLNTQAATSNSKLSSNSETVEREFNTQTNAQIFYSLVKYNYKQVVGSIYFKIIIILGLIGSAFMISDTITTDGVANYPLTGKIFKQLLDVFYMFLIIIVTVYSGELMWRERNKKLNQLYDTLPVSEWLTLIAKFISLVLIQLSLIAALLLFSIVIQTYLGYYNYELDVYLKIFIFTGLFPTIIFSGVAIFFQAIVNNKYAGYFLMVIYFIFIINASKLGFDHSMLVFGSTPGFNYSEMNGFGNSFFPSFIFNLYWLFLLAALLAVATVFVHRGTDTGFRNRLRNANIRFTNPIKLFIALMMGLFAISGIYIFYNTNIINKYTSRSESISSSVNYELNYHKYSSLLQPRITKVFVETDIFPSKRKIHFKGNYRLLNKSKSNIDSIVISENSRMKLVSLKFDLPDDEVVKDVKQGFYLFKLKKSLHPGDSIRLSFEVDYTLKGFSLHEDSRLLSNGTYFSNQECLPTIGYDYGKTISNEKLRKKQNLPVVKTFESINDSTLLYKNGSDADWIDLECIVSTENGQTALAPGELINQWNSDGRNFYHYKSFSKNLNVYSFLSAKYSIKKETWNGISLEIYYHPTHSYNIDRFFDAMKRSLEYYTTNFGPYQNKTLKIVEFPFGSNAKALSGSIQIGENLGFISQFSRDSALVINHVYEVTAHEIGHQYFAYQVVGANVKGSQVLSEVFSQYLALCVLSKIYKPEVINDFLHNSYYKYMNGRNSDKEVEPPLAQVSDQDYIFYHKGTLVMNTLKEYLGEDSVNRAISRFLIKYKFTEPPYPTSFDFLKELKKSCPDSLKYLITDLFETVTIFSNEAKKAEFKKLPDGKFDVTLYLEATKIKTDSLGNKTNALLNDYIEVGVLDKNKNPIFITMHKFTKSAETLRFTVEKEPCFGVIDPRHLLIDQIWRDNIIKFIVSK